MTAITVRDVEAQKFVRAYAAHLKRGGKLAVPEWVDIVKTGTHKELSPYDPDWFYTRVAAIARHLYIRPDAGVGAMRLVFGGKKNRGVRPSHHGLSSGSVARKAMQALESLKILEKGPEGKGRRVSSTGRKDLDQIAALVAKSA